MGFKDFMEAFGSGIENHPIKITVLLLGLIVVGIVIYWVVDNWPLIKSLGLGAVLAAGIGFIGYIIAGIVGVALPALLAGVKALKASREKIAEDKATKEAEVDDAVKAGNMTAEEGAAAKTQIAAEATAAEGTASTAAQQLTKATNAQAQAQESGTASTTKATFDNGAEKDYDNTDDAVDNIGQDIDANGPLVAAEPVAAI